jgi:predicted dehydrogenase
LSRVRLAVAGAGQFGRNHLRVIRASERAELVAVHDADADRARAAAQEFGCRPVADLAELPDLVDAAVIATPTTTHAAIGCRLLESNVDVLVEKPIASSLEEAELLAGTARALGRVLQVGHLERFNPCVQALEQRLTIPLFFEIHRLNVFSPRSLDVDVILDLMIHDIDIVLAMTRLMPHEVRAAGISILSPKVDIANVRLAFPNGCVANLTASRVSTERVRKLRLFQPHQYVSLDYSKQEAAVFAVRQEGPPAGPLGRISFEMLRVDKQEPLRLQFESFLDAVINRAPPRVDGEQAGRALKVSFEILAKIEEHSHVVACSIAHGSL